MTDTLPKILMLGWEFPPVINGGLGVACHDLCQAMSSKADISMIIPKSKIGYSLPGMDLIGLNNIDASSLSSYSPVFTSDLYKSAEFVDANLNPYYQHAEGTGSDCFSEKNQQVKRFVNRFEIDSLYDGNVIEKVLCYSEMATAIALQKDFDVIHAHDWMTMIAGMEIKARTGKPLVVHIHSLEYDRSGEDSKGWVYQVEKKGMEAADVLLPVSNYTANVIAQHYNIDRRKIYTVHNGIRNVQSFRSESRFPEKIVLFVGRLTRQKGPEHFLDIASKVLEKDNNVRFIMAGTGDYYKSLLENSAYRSLSNRFHLTGFLNTEKLNNLLSIADVYCMPSVSEPFGLSAVEAVQFGIPCVISKQSGVAEVLNGSLKFDFWDINKASDYIINLLSDHTLRNRVVHDGYNDLQHISWNSSADKVINAYKTHKIIAN
jgi:glycogen synthase